MTRKWFLSLLGIGAAGQSTSITEWGQKTKRSEWKKTPGFRPVVNANCTDKNICMVGVDGTQAKPANGECPVCGTMAPAYFPQKGRVVATHPPSNWPDEPPTRTVSCTHCRVRFDQDAEGVK